jgi:hypothetical protein
MPPMDIKRAGSIVIVAEHFETKTMTAAPAGE